MNKNFDTIGSLLLKEIEKRFDNEPLEIPDIEFSENFVEMIERFIILHIRVWKLEDAVGEATTDSEIAELKKKIDFCFKVLRPKLIKAINSYLNIHIDKNHYSGFQDENIKHYKGYSDDSISK